MRTAGNESAEALLLEIRGAFMVSQTRCRPAKLYLFKGRMPLVTECTLGTTGLHPNGG